VCSRDDGGDLQLLQHRPRHAHTEQPSDVIACIEEHDVAKKILGLPAEPLSTARAQAPPVTLELFPAA
jgi:hypothetical protein